ncbi:Predicted membrane-bound metal-dependent hydrolase (DUF457) (plasmid) [Halogeometricum borinquense DSM 11551]|uniref:Predicted membrane-bound metal-dependent hydrolase (DUF457) n=4 Tax=Halogeometricum borinquense TaxID=60847 RepID=E4NVV7_HALBP|nr:Predicted membrane-bound metal-dependent hydrolase (DUF457) [Halogeometricum borinquense DSM 11551]
MTRERSNLTLESSGRDIGTLTDTDAVNSIDPAVTSLATTGGLEQRISSIATLDTARLGGTFAQRIIRKRGAATLIFRSLQNAVQDDTPDEAEPSDDFYSISYPSLEETYPQYDSETPEWETPDSGTARADPPLRTTRPSTPDLTVQQSDAPQPQTHEVTQNPNSLQSEAAPDQTAQSWLDEDSDTPKSGVTAEAETESGQHRTDTPSSVVSTPTTSGQNSGRAGSHRPSVERTDAAIRTVSQQLRRVSRRATGARTVLVDQTDTDSTTLAGQSNQPLSTLTGQTNQQSTTPTSQTNRQPISTDEYRAGDSNRQQQTPTVAPSASSPSPTVLSEHETESSTSSSTSGKRISNQRTAHESRLTGTQHESGHLQGSRASTPKARQRRIPRTDSSQSPTAGTTTAHETSVNRSANPQKSNGQRSALWTPAATASNRSPESAVRASPTTERPNSTESTTQRSLSGSHERSASSTSLRATASTIPGPDVETPVRATTRTRGIAAGRESNQTLTSPSRTAAEREPTQRPSGTTVTASDSSQPTAPTADSGPFQPSLGVTPTTVLDTPVQRQPGSTQESAVQRANYESATTSTRTRVVDTTNATTASPVESTSPTDSDSTPSNRDWSTPTSTPTQGSRRTLTRVSDTGTGKERTAEGQLRSPWSQSHSSQMKTAADTSATSTTAATSGDRVGSISGAIETANRARTEIAENDSYPNRPTASSTDPSTAADRLSRQEFGEVDTANRARTQTRTGVSASGTDSSVPATRSSATSESANGLDSQVSNRSGSVAPENSTRPNSHVQSQRTATRTIDHLTVHRLSSQSAITDGTTGSSLQRTHAMGGAKRALTAGTQRRPETSTTRREQVSDSSPAQPTTQSAQSDTALSAGDVRARDSYATGATRTRFRQHAESQSLQALDSGSNRDTESPSPLSSPSTDDITASEGRITRASRTEAVQPSDSHSVQPLNAGDRRATESSPTIDDVSSRGEHTTETGRSQTGTRLSNQSAVADVPTGGIIQRTHTLGSVEHRLTSTIREHSLMSGTNRKQVSARSRPQSAATKVRTQSGTLPAAGSSGSREGATSEADGARAVQHTESRSPQAPDVGEGRSTQSVSPSLSESPAQSRGVQKTSQASRRSTGTPELSTEAPETQQPVRHSSHTNVPPATNVPVTTNTTTATTPHATNSSSTTTTPQTTNSAATTSTPRTTDSLRARHAQNTAESGETTAESGEITASRREEQRIRETTPHLRDQRSSNVRSQARGQPTTQTGTRTVALPTVESGIRRPSATDPDSRTWTDQVSTHGTDETASGRLRNVDAPTSLQQTFTQGGQARSPAPSQPASAEIVSGAETQSSDRPALIPRSRRRSQRPSNESTPGNRDTPTDPSRDVATGDYSTDTDASLHEDEFRPQQSVGYDTPGWSNESSPLTALGMSDATGKTGLSVIGHEVFERASRSSRLGSRTNPTSGRTNPTSGRTTTDSEARRVVSPGSPDAPSSETRTSRTTVSDHSNHQSARPPSTDSVEDAAWDVSSQLARTATQYAANVAANRRSQQSESVPKTVAQNVRRSDAPRNDVSEPASQVTSGQETRDPVQNPDAPGNNAQTEFKYLQSAPSASQRWANEGASGQASPTSGTVRQRQNIGGSGFETAVVQRYQPAAVSTPALDWVSETMQSDATQLAQSHRSHSNESGQNPGGKTLRGRAGGTDDPTALVRGSAPSSPAVDQRQHRSASETSARQAVRQRGASESETVPQPGASEADTARRPNVSGGDGEMPTPSVNPRASERVSFPTALSSSRRSATKTRSTRTEASTGISAKTSSADWPTQSSETLSSATAVSDDTESAVQRSRTGNSVNRSGQPNLTGASEIADTSGASPSVSPAARVFARANKARTAVEGTRTSAEGAHTSGEDTRSSAEETQTTVEGAQARVEATRTAVEGTRTTVREATDDGNANRDGSVVDSGVKSESDSDRADSTRSSPSMSGGIVAGDKTSLGEKVKYKNRNIEYNTTDEGRSRKTSGVERMSMPKPQTEPSLVYRQERSPATGQQNDDRVAGDTQRAGLTGESLHGQPRANQQQPSHMARSSTRQGNFTSGVGTNQGPTEQDRHGIQRQGTASHRGDTVSGSPFDSNGPQNTDLRSATSQTGVSGHPSENDHSQRAQGRIDDLDIQLSDQSLQLNADVDRLVDVLYRKLERKRRMERQRRGF